MRHSRLFALVFLSTICVLLCPAQTEAPREVTLCDLATNPSNFDGKFVRVRASASIGWEGDNFLVEPHESSPPKRCFSARVPLSIWITCKSVNACSGLVGLQFGGSGAFTGKFHSPPDAADRTRVKVFDPGPLQLEVTRISDIKYSDFSVESWFNSPKLSWPTIPEPY